MSENQIRLYDEIIKEYQKTDSVKETAENLGVSKNTVQRVLITENLWESNRSREVKELLSKGYSTQQIADKLFLSIKCVQNYMPYSKGMYGESDTVNAELSRNKRERMKYASGHQVLQTIVKNNKNDEEVKSMTDTQHTETNGSVYKLHLELVNYTGKPFKFSRDEKEILSKYAHMSRSFQRDILVPSNMTLKSLHYVIQKLFGWQNSHLHQFVFTENVHDKITYCRDTEKLLKLLGVCLRIPTQNMADLYCADDYDESCSFKSWLKDKYVKNQSVIVVGDTYFDSQYLAEQIKTEKMDLSNDYSFGIEIIEGRTVSDLFITSENIPSLEEWENSIDQEIARVDGYIKSMPKARLTEIKNKLNSLRMLRIRRQEIIGMIEEGQKAESQYEACSKQIKETEQYLLSILLLLQPRMFPITDTLIYRYDYGDDWCVKITCKEIISEEKKNPPELQEKIDKVFSKHVPVCLKSDGICLLDDVGGINGFIQMLVDLHYDKENASEIKEWARMMGWTGRKVKEENML